MIMRNFFAASVAVSFLVLAIAGAGCTGEGWTHENGGGSTTAAAQADAGSNANANADTGSAAQADVAPVCNCTKPAGSFWSRVVNGGHTLETIKTTGGCDVSGGCKSVSANIPVACDGVWIDKLGGSSGDWVEFSTGRFECQLAVASCNQVACASGNYCNKGTGQCAVLPAGTKICGGGKTCSVGGKEAYCSGNKTVAYDHFGHNVCYSDGGSEYCAPVAGSTKTIDCGASATCTGNGTCVAKAPVGGNTGGSTPAPTVCTATGCPAGQACNANTGFCAASGANQGDLSCFIQRADSTTWHHLNGGGVAGVAQAGMDAWSNLGTPNASGTVGFTILAGQGAASILPEIVSGAQWAFGSLAGFTDPQIVGEWKIFCDGNPPYTFKQGATPVCSSSTPANTGCTWAGGGGKYRLVFRAR